MQTQRCKGSKQQNDGCCSKRGHCASSCQQIVSRPSSCSAQTVYREGYGGLWGFCSAQRDSGYEMQLESSHKWYHVPCMNIFYCFKHGKNFRASCAQDCELKAAVWSR